MEGGLSNIQTTMVLLHQNGPTKERQLHMILAIPSAPREGFHLNTTSDDSSATSGLKREESEEGTETESSSLSKEDYTTEDDSN